MGESEPYLYVPVSDSGSDHFVPLQDLLIDLTVLFSDEEMKYME
jgi:hypothetical protein